MSFNVGQKCFILLNAEHPYAKLMKRRQEILMIHENIPKFKKRRTSTAAVVGAGVREEEEELRRARDQKYI